MSIDMKIEAHLGHEKTHLLLILNHCNDSSVKQSCDSESYIGISLYVVKW